jgi:hypothetical protein
MTETKRASAKKAARPFKAGDWVNIESDAEDGNRDPGKITRVEADGGIYIRWPWNGHRACPTRWDAKDLVRVDAPASLSEAR